MSYLLFRPHVVGPEDKVTTPDLLVDRVLLLNDGERNYLPVHRLLPNAELQVVPGEIAVTPAFALVASGGGVLFSFAALIHESSDAAKKADILVARSAWRFRNLVDHIGALTIHLNCGGNSSSIMLSDIAQSTEVMNRPDDEEYALPRGIVVLYSAPSATVLASVPAKVSVKISDKTLDRNLSHSINLESVDSDPWDERPLPRYTVGPVGDVQHYI